MAISKLILNGEVQMDVTSDTVAASSLLSGKTATKNDGTKVTGTIASKSSSDLTASGATVTAPAGYYANAASKAVTTTTHPNPSASITSSTGVVTATHTQTAGYVTAGTTTGTLNLTTQAGKTVTPTETAQTAVASYRWTTGPISVAAISSTYVGTGVAKKSSADLTASGSTVTAPAGYYSTAATKSIGAGSAFPPAVTITKAPTIGVNTSGVVTASYTGSSSITPTVTSGYISQGTAGTISTTGTSTYQLTSKAAATYYPSTADQTIASQRWLVGNQTIKSVTTSNLTAENIAEGVVVKVGDSANASRITQVTGTHKSGGYTCTISNGSSGSRYIRYNNDNYTSGEIVFNKDDVLKVSVNGSSDWDAYLYINNKLIIGPVSTYINYNITPNADVTVSFTSGNHRSYAYITIPEINITENGQYEVGGYGYANVDVKPTYTATLTNAGNSATYIKYNSINYNGAGDTISVNENETIRIVSSYGNSNRLFINDVLVAGGTNGQTVGYNYTMTSDVEISFSLSLGVTDVYITELSDISALTITQNGTYTASGDIRGYSPITVNVSGGGGDISTVSVTVTTSLSDIITGPIYNEENSLNGNTLFTGSWSATGLSFSVLYNENFNIDEGGGYFYYGNRIQYVSSADRTITPTNNIQLDGSSTIGNCKIYHLLIMGDNASFTVT